MNSPDHKPGDFLLDRYFPDADEATRERAREAFRDHVILLHRIGQNIRAVRQHTDSTLRDDGVTLQ